MLLCFTLPLIINQWYYFSLLHIILLNFFHLYYYFIFTTVKLIMNNSSNSSVTRLTRLTKTFLFQNHRGNELCWVVCVCCVLCCASFYYTNHTSMWTFVLTWSYYFWYEKNSISKRNLKPIIMTRLMSRWKFKPDYSIWNYYKYTKWILNLFSSLRPWAL